MREERVVGRGDAVVGERVARGRDEDGIDDERTVEVGDGGDDRFEGVGRSEHSRLGRADVVVVGDGVELGGDVLGGEVVDAVDAAGVLRGDARDDARPVGAAGLHRLEVGLYAGGAAGVGAGDGECDGVVDGGGATGHATTSGPMRASDGGVMEACITQ